jgi:hypothetical protein
MARAPGVKTIELNRFTANHVLFSFFLFVSSVLHLNAPISVRWKIRGKLWKCCLTGNSVREHFECLINNICQYFKLFRKSKFLSFYFFTEPNARFNLLQHAAILLAIYAWRQPTRILIFKAPGLQSALVSTSD